MTLDLVGDGPLRDELQAHAARLGLRAVCGSSARSTTARSCGGSRSHEWAAVVLASSVTDEAQEGMPVSLMEAMASLVPVVATDSGGTGELVGGGAGLLVPVGDAAALADALRSGRHRCRAAAAGWPASGRQRVAESFDVRVVAAELRTRFAGCAA